MTEQASMAPAQPQQAWHALAPEAVLEALSVDAAAGLATAEVDRRRATYGANKFAEAPREPRWRAFLRQYQRPDAARAAGRRRRVPVPARPDPDRDRAHPPDGLQRPHGREPGGQGRGERRGAPEDDGRAGQGPTRRRGRADPDGGSRSRRHRERRGGRPRARGRPGDPGGDARNRRIRPDRGERPGAQAGRGRRGGRGPWRPRRHGVHEHPGDTGCGDVRRHVHRHGDRGRPHLRHAFGAGRRGDAAHETAQQPDEPDPPDRRRRAGDLRRARPLPGPVVRHRVPDRRGVRRFRDPDRPARCRDDRPRRRHLDAGQGRRHREAAPLGGNARLHVRDQLRQDGHAHAEPDDRRADGDRRPPLLDQR